MTLLKVKLLFSFSGALELSHFMIHECFCVKRSAKQKKKETLDETGMSVGNKLRVNISLFIQTIVLKKM